MALRLTSATPRTALLSVELRRRDGKPIPGDITFDIAVTDNRLVQYNVPSTYQGYGARGEEVSTVEGNGAHRIKETLNTGPLHDRVRWFLIKVTIYSQKPKPSRAQEFLLTQIETLDLGKHPVPTAATDEAIQSVSLVGRKVPIYPGARDLKAWNLAGSRAAGVYYVVPGLPYPSRDVADFYGEWALDHDWMPDKRSAQTWRDFLDGTQPGEPWVYQLLLEWTGRISGERLILSCQYRIPKGRDGTYSSTDLGRDQIVAVGIYPADSVGQRPKSRHR